MRLLIFSVLLIISKVVIADPAPFAKPEANISNSNPCPTNDAVCAAKKLKELQEAAADHEKNMEELKLRGLVK